MEHLKVSKGKATRPEKRHNTSSTPGRDQKMRPDEETVARLASIVVSIPTLELYGVMSGTQISVISGSVTALAAK